MPNGEIPMSKEWQNPNGDARARRRAVSDFEDEDEPYDSRVFCNAGVPSAISFKLIDIQAGNGVVFGCHSVVMSLRARTQR